MRHDKSRRIEKMHGIGLGFVIYPSSGLYLYSGLYLHIGRFAILLIRWDRS